jgi:DNA-cytosine methyltransferase
MRQLGNVLSLFDGMSCGQIALNRAGIKYENYYSSEIDPYAIKVSKFNYPSTIQLGDITKIDWDKLPKIDLILAGSPCQGFSFAGKQLAFNDPRSKLFFEFVKALKILKPKYFLLENVKMKKEHEEVITSMVGVSPIEINSSLVSAQNRKRLYWTNIPNIDQPKDKNITWGKIREYDVSSNKYYYTEKALQWLARHSRKKNKILKIHSNEEKMQMLEASHHKKYSAQRFFGIVEILRKNKDYNGKYFMNFKNSNCDINFKYDKKNKIVLTISKDNLEVPFTSSGKVPSNGCFFRYITPLECERLQTVPDNYTEIVSDSQRYRMLGNGWTVDVIAHILNNI